MTSSKHLVEARLWPKLKNLTEGSIVIGSLYTRQWADFRIVGNFFF